MREVVAMAGVSFSVGVLKLATLIRDKRRVRWIDILIEPSFAVFAGLLSWAISKHLHTPHLIELVIVSLAAWGGPKTINALEKKYFPDASQRDEPKPG